MVSTRTAIVFGLCAYLLFLAFTMPAERVYSLAREQLAAPPLKLSLAGIDGSWLDGAADEAMVAGVQLDGLEWRLLPLELLRARLAAEVALRSGEDRCRGTLAYGIGGLTVTDLEGRLPLELLAPLWSQFGLRLSGTAHLAVARLRLDHGTMAAVDGTVVWQDARLVAPQRLALGDLKATMETTGEGVRMVLSDAGGPVAADGVMTIKPDGSYSFSGSFAARDQATPQLARSLRLLGQPAPDGRITVSYSGTLKL